MARSIETDRLFLIRTLDPQGNPLPFVSIHADSLAGEWNAITNPCGEFAPILTYAKYRVTFARPGFVTRTIDWDLNKDTPLDPILVGLERDSNVFPNYPTRDQVCNVFCGFQGISILTKQYGWIPAFGPEVGWLNEEDCISYCEQMRKLSFTHVEMTVSGQYDEPDYHYPVPGKDFTHDLPALQARLDLIIRQGMFIKLSLAGDGLSNPNGGYNDPYGWTYGYEWLMSNMERILVTLSSYQGHDLNRFILYVPGYDAVFYGWDKKGEVPDLQPQRVIEFGKRFRSILPNGYLGIEHTPGNIPVGEGSANWVKGGELDAFDTLFSEFNPFNVHEDTTWQILPRCYRPYHRPPDQPTGDDPSPDFYLVDCTRGRRFYIIYEIVTYLWVRGKISIQECNEIYDYYMSMSPDCTICMIRQAA